jgi:NADH-quinone oxidoreductase subunit J
MGVGLVAATTKVDFAVFAASAVIILAGAVGVVISRNAVHAALSLVMTLFGVAVLFVAQQAHFLAAVQVIVYAGAIVVLFLFVIMLLGVDREENVRLDDLKGQRPVAVLLGVIGLAELFLLSRGSDWVTGAESVVASTTGPGSNVEKLAEVVFTRYLFAFEVTSVLLVIAVVGAVVLARKPGRRVGDEGYAAPGSPEPGEDGSAEAAVGSHAPGPTEAGVGDANADGREPAGAGKGATP